MSRGKLGFALGLLLAAIVGGWFLSGYLVLLFLGLHNAPFAWNTWQQYFQARELAQFAPYAGKIKLAGYGGFGVPAALWLVVVFLLFRPREKAFHGDARFADSGDIRKAGLFDDMREGIVIGRYRGKLLRLGGAQHVIVTAPTRTGKSTGIAIPVLLTFGHSIVVLDLKGELYMLTSGWRAAQGQKIRVFAPYDADGKTHRFNPFQSVSPDPRQRFNDIQTIAAILYPDVQGKDPFWINTARGAFAAFTGYLFDTWDHEIATQTARKTPRESFPDPNTSPDFPSFERIYRLSTGHGKPVRGIIQHYLNDSRYRYLSEQTRTAFASLVSLAEQTFSSVIGSMQEPLQQFNSPILAAATNASDFSVSTLRKELTTVYVVIPPDKLGESSKLLNIFFSTVVGQNLKATPQVDKSLKYQMLLLMDEFTAMGRVNVLSDRISLTAGYNIRDLTIIQSTSQLEETYGAAAARNYITNHACSIVFTPREQQDAENYSRQLGDTTIKRRSKTVAKGGNVSYSYTEERRPLMLPQELKELKYEEIIVFLEGCRPIKAKKLRYFKDPYFKKRLMPKVEIKVVAQADTQRDAGGEKAFRPQNEQEAKWFQ